MQPFRPIFRLFPLLLLASTATQAHAVTIINTDSTVGAPSRSAPPLPSTAPDSEAQQPTSGEPLAEWILPDGSTQQASATGLSDKKRSSRPPLPQMKAGVDKEGGLVGQNDSVSNTVPKKTDSPVDVITWNLEPGSLYEQVTQWGADDPIWDVTWVAEEDVEVEVPHRFAGPLDEVVIQIIKAFAHQGVAIRALRAKANNQLVIKGR